MSADIICYCCGGLFYGKSVTELKKETIIARGAADDFLTSITYVYEHDTSFCHTCKRNILQLNVPKLALSNGLDFPEIDTCLKVIYQKMYPS